MVNFLRSRVTLQRRLAELLHSFEGILFIMKEMNVVGKGALELFHRPVRLL